MFLPNNDSSIIEKGVHCPFCNTKEAFLMCRTSRKKLSFQTPAFGLRFILLLLFHPLTILLYGFKMFEIAKCVDYSTYGFCPACGNSYSAAPPDTVKKEVSAPKFYRIKARGKIAGLCAGIADYTGLNLLWVRIVSVVYGFTAFVIAIVASINAIRAEVPFGDVLSGIVQQSIPTVGVIALYLIVSLVVSDRSSQGGNSNVR
jgi:phage shock protein PspC (stress-responsive transcriptional regulator)